MKTFITPEPSQIRLALIECLHDLIEFHQLAERYFSMVQWCFLNFVLSGLAALITVAFHCPYWFPVIFFECCFLFFFAMIFFFVKYKHIEASSKFLREYTLQLEVKLITQCSVEERGVDHEQADRTVGEED